MHIHVQPTGPGRYSARLGDRLLCESRTPFLSAARVLLQEGVAEETILTMTHRGSSVASLRAPLGVAAGLRVVENDRTGPRFDRYQTPPAEMPFAVTRGSPRTATNALEHGGQGQTETTKIDSPLSKPVVAV